LVVHEDAPTFAASIQNMVNKIIKIVLGVLVLAWAVYEFSEVHIGNGILAILILGIIVLLWFKHEVNLLAFLQIRRQKFESAKKILSWVKKPEQMNRSQEAYYYFLNGLVESQGKNIGGSEKFFKKALNTGLNMDHDKAMAHLNLAGVAMARRRKREAMNYLTQVKKYDKAKLLSDQVKMLKSQMGKI
jgi:tetratricopeptide (TPR) repeat protein